VEIITFQSHADVNVQKSTREGVGLTVSEVLWKGRPTIGGDVGGIPRQIEDGITGYLVQSAAECAERCLEVLADAEMHRQMALLGKEKVRREFLTPRLLRDDLRLFADLEAGKIGT
jgi:trehalose synthase